VLAEVPPGVLTVTFTAPAVRTGDLAVHDVFEGQLTAVPALDPKAIFVAPATKPVPVTVTTAPPPRRPPFGVM
jgi:hypothetical protein